MGSLAYAKAPATSSKTPTSSGSTAAVRESLSAPLSGSKAYQLVIVAGSSAAMSAVRRELGRLGRSVDVGAPVELTFPGPASVANSVTQAFSWLPFTNSVRRGYTLSTVFASIRAKGAKSMEATSRPISSVDRAIVMNAPEDASLSEMVASATGAAGRAASGLSDALAAPVDAANGVAHAAKVTAIAVGVGVAALVAGVVYAVVFKTESVATIAASTARIVR